ncbi:hypothetical protein GCM10027290_36620 [Micromonospora sonneratiae]|uniref:Polysaccharide biosynthesis protein n=1 Tax=Micromonospora sonneratiae TaxID=1184706 RepID=A0ABW3YI48_9ACTN
MTQHTRSSPGNRTSTGRLGIAGAAVTVAAMLTNGLAYLVPMLGARHLTAADLSALATVLALTGIAGVPGLGLQIAIAVRRARHGHVPAARVAVTTAALTGGVLVVLSPLLMAFLQLTVELAALLTAMTVAVVLSGRWLGELQGDQRFLRLAAGMAVLAVGRYGGVIVGLLLGAGLLRSLLAGVVVGCLFLPVLAWLAAPTPAAAERTPSATEPTAAAPIDAAGPVTSPGPALRAREVLTASSATLAMLTVSYADLILARQLLPVAGSGAYAVGTVLTKGALWAPQVVTVLALPRLANGDRRTRSVALAVTAACGVVLVVASALAGGFAFQLAGGADYVHLGGYAPFFAATGALYALVFVLVNARVAAGARRPAGPLWLATGGLVIIATLVAPHTFAGILGSSLAMAAVTVVLLAWLTRRSSDSQAQMSH